MNIKTYVFESIWIWFLLLAMALGVVTLSYTSDIQIKNAYQNLFLERQDEVIDEIEHTIVTYMEVLRAGRGLYDASTYVSHDEWSAFVKSLRLEKNFPGIRTLGYAKLISKQDRGDFEVDIRERGFSEFRVYPITEDPVGVVATYVEPYDALNRELHGFDMWSDEDHRAVLEKALLANTASISKRLVLQENGHTELDLAGFLVFMPVYQKEAQAPYALEDVDGFIYGVFQLSKVLNRINGSERYNFRVEIFDGKSVNEVHKMYDSHAVDGAQSNMHLSNVQTLQINNKIWTMRFTSLPEFAPNIDLYYPVKILLAGTLLCLLALVTLWSLRGSKKIAEIIAQERTADLAQSEEKFRSAMEHSPVGMALLSPDGSWLKVNKALCSMLGYEEIEFLSTDFQTLTHPDDLDADLDLVTQVLEGRIDDYKLEKRYIRKDGKTIWGLLSVSLLRDVDGNPKHFISQIQDISDIKKAQQTLEELNTELEEFSYRTSHDLRSPLTSSIGLLKYADESLEKGEQEKARTSLSLAQDSLKKLEELLKDILDLARLKNMEEEEQPVSIKTLVDDALDKFTHMNNYDRLEFKLDLQYDEDIHTKKTRLLMIVENLISNAIKYQDTSKKKSFVKVETYEDGENVVFAVDDNGLGIPDDQQENMFVMFKRFHPRVSFGSGLGMYMMKKSADVIGGDIRFVNKKDGSRFELILPKHNIREKRDV